MNEAENVGDCIQDSYIGHLHTKKYAVFYYTGISGIITLWIYIPMSDNL